MSCAWTKQCLPLCSILHHCLWGEGGSPFLRIHNEMSHHCFSSKCPKELCPGLQLALAIFGNIGPWSFSYETSLRLVCTATTLGQYSPYIGRTPHLVFLVRILFYLSHTTKISGYILPVKLILINNKLLLVIISKYNYFSFPFSARLLTSVHLNILFHLQLDFYLRKH